jgi:hypothetical protein
VFTGMLPHVDAADGFNTEFCGRVCDRLWVTGQRNDGAVVVCIWFNAKDGTPVNPCSVYDGGNDISVTAFRDVWHTLNDGVHAPLVRRTRP